MTPPETDAPYDVLVVRPDEIDDLMSERLGAARQYDDPALAQVYRSAVMQTLMCLEQYHGVAIPGDGWRQSRADG